MKNLRAKLIGMRTIGSTALAFALFAVMALSQEAAVMTAGWEGFYTQMKGFFYDGLGGAGMQGVGLVIVSLGILFAAISFVVHKVNPQSRMPGWITCLVIAVIGAILLTGISGPLAIIKKIRDLILGWFGLTSTFGSDAI